MSMAGYPIHGCGGVSEMLDGQGLIDISTDQALSTCPFLPPVSVSSFPSSVDTTVASVFPQSFASTSSQGHFNSRSERLSRDPARSLHTNRFLKHSLHNAQPILSKENHEPQLLGGITTAESGDLYPLALETSLDSLVRLSQHPSQRCAAHAVTSSVAPFCTLSTPTVTGSSDASHQSYQDMFAAAGVLDDFGNVTAEGASGPQPPGSSASPGASLSCGQLLDLLETTSATERMVHTSISLPCLGRPLPASSNGSRSSSGKGGSCWKAAHNMPRPALLAKSTTKVSAGKGRTSLALLDKLEKVEGTEWEQIGDCQHRDGDSYPQAVAGARLRHTRLPLISNCALGNRVTVSRSSSTASRYRPRPRPEVTGSSVNPSTAATEMSTNPQQYPASAQVACMWNPSPACVPPNQAWQTSSEASPAGPNFRFVLNTFGVPAHILSNSGPSSGPPPSTYLPTAAAAAERPVQIPTSSHPVATQLHTPGSSGSEVGTPNGKSLNLPNAHAMQQQQQHQFSAPAAITRGNASPVGAGHVDASVATERSNLGMTYSTGISSCSGHSANGFHSEQQQQQQQGNSSHWLLDKTRPIYQHAQHQAAGPPRGVGPMGMVPVHGRSDSNQSPYQHHMHTTHGPCNQSGMRSPQFRSGHSPHAGYDSMRQDHGGGGGAPVSMLPGEYPAPAAQHLYGVAPAGGFAPRPLTMQPASHPGFRSPVLPHQPSSLPVQGRTYSPLINQAAAASPQQYSPEDSNGEQIFLGQLPGSPLRSRYLWLFLLRLLEDSRYSAFITWTRRRDLEFQLRQPEEVATLWGRVKRRSNMTYDKMSRAMRYYYRQNVLRKVRNKRYVYRFLRIPSLEQQASSLPASTTLANMAANDRSPGLSHSAVAGALGAKDAHSDPESNDGEDDNLPLSPLPAKSAPAAISSAISAVKALDIAAIIADPPKAEQSPNSESDASR